MYFDLQYYNNKFLYKVECNTLVTSKLQHSTVISRET
jgi:hypothetical protein